MTIVSDVFRGNHVTDAYWSVAGLPRQVYDVENKNTKIKIGENK
jgi:hypothetical protein